MNFIKQEGDLQPILQSLGQFWLINKKISKFFDCNLHLFKFIKILTMEKLLLLSILDPTMAPIVQNIDSCFCHQCKGHFISFTSTWYCLKMRSSLFTSSFCWLTCIGNLLKYIQTTLIINTNVSKGNFSFYQWIQMVMALQQQGFLIILLNNSNTLSSSMNEDTKQRLLNLESNIKENILWFLFFSKISKKKRKDSNITQIFFLMF